MEYDKYFIPIGYKINDKEAPCDLTAIIKSGDPEAYQWHVYNAASKLVDNESTTKILDIGCGSAYKLLHFFKGCQTLGIDIEPNYEALPIQYPDRKWEYADYSKPLTEYFDLIICADVIEHTWDPDILMEYISKSNANYVVFSTPARELLRELNGKFVSDWGPPKNHRHIREWATDEFIKYISKWFNIEFWNISYNSEPAGITVIIKRK